MTDKEPVRTRRWAPLTVLGFVVLFSVLGFEPSKHHGSVLAAVAGLVVGLVVVGLVHFVRKP